MSERVSIGSACPEVPGTSNPVRLEPVPEVEPDTLEPADADQRGRVPLPLAGFVMPPCMAGFHHPCI